MLSSIVAICIVKIPVNKTSELNSDLRRYKYNELSIQLIDSEYLDHIWIEL